MCELWIHLLYTYDIRMRLNRRGKLESWHVGEQGVLEFRRANQKGGEGGWKRAKQVKYITQIVIWK